MFLTSQPLIGLETVRWRALYFFLVAFSLFNFSSGSLFSFMSFQRVKLGGGGGDKGEIY